MPAAPSTPSGGAASNVSPWSESADMPAVPTSPQAANSSSSNLGDRVAAGHSGSSQSIAERTEHSRCV